MSKQATVCWLGALLLSVASILLTCAVYTQMYYPAMVLDEWGELGFYFDKGFWPSVFCQQNHHVVILPKIVTRLLFLASDADPYIRGLSTLLSASLLGVMVGYASSRASGNGNTPSRIVRVSRFTVALAFTLWLVSYQQLFWGMAHYSYFSLLFGFAAVAALDAILQSGRKTGIWLLLPAVLATASMASFTYGVAAWGALAVMLLLHRKPWQGIAATLILGLGLFVSLRVGMPHCRPLSSIATDGSIVDPLVLIESLLVLHGSVWTQSLAPLMPPSSFHATIVGTLGLGLLCWLTLLAWKTGGYRAFKLLVTGCWMVTGMLLLVALGRNPASFAFPDQMIAPRFMPLSIFFWTCLLAACGFRPGKTSQYMSATWGAVHAVIGCYLLLTAVLTVSWMSSMRSEDMHFTSAEIKVEAIRTWVSPETSGKIRTTNTLGLLDPALFRKHVGELRQRNWDFYQAFPSPVFPVRVAELPDESPASAAASPVLDIEKSQKTPGGSWTLSGSLRGDVPPEAEHLFFARGDTIVGYGVPALYPAFDNKPRRPLAGFRDVPARLSAAVRRLGQLLRSEHYWNGVSNADPGLGEWHCAWRSDTTLLCRAAAELDRAGSPSQVRSMSDS